MLIKQVPVLIKRGDQIIAVSVKEYEVDILRAIHGDDDRFQLDKSEKADNIELVNNFEEEYQRLSMVYKRDFLVFQNVYRNAEELKKAITSASVKGSKETV
jgi:hypothetical protein